MQRGESYYPCLLANIRYVRYMGRTAYLGMGIATKDMDSIQNILKMTIERGVICCSMSYCNLSASTNVPG